MFSLWEWVKYPCGGIEAGDGSSRCAYRIEKGTGYLRPKINDEIIRDASCRCYAHLGLELSTVGKLRYIFDFCDMTSLHHIWDCSFCNSGKSCTCQSGRVFYTYA